MADATEGDTMVLYLGILILALITLIPGLVIHSFIIVVNVNDWRKGRSVTPVDQVVMSLGISRMSVQCAVTIYSILAVYLHMPLIIIDLAFAFFIYLNVWLTSLLSIVFCVKISSLRTRLFLYLRRMIEQRTVHFIAASGLLCTVNRLLLLSPTIKEVTNGRDNTTLDSLLMACNVIDSVYGHVTGSSIPLLFHFISSVVLFTSLYHHITKMKMSGNLFINMETYYSALKFVSFTFICNTIYFSGHFICAFYYFLYCVKLVWLNPVLAFLPALHSSYLIYRTAKLRSQMSKVLQNVVEFLLQKKIQI